MKPAHHDKISQLQEQAETAAALLKLMSNKNRLVILCRLSLGEATVSELCETAELSQSALSQHLKKMRLDGLVSGRKQGLQVFYSISDPRCIGILEHLKTEFCTSVADHVAGQGVPPD